MNDTTAAHRLREQLKRFVGIVFPHVPKLQKEFLGQMFFGIQAGQTTVLSRIARELDEDILLKKTEERLSRHLLAAKLDETVRDAVLAHGAAYVHDDTVVSIDPSDIQKPYAQEGGMPFLAKVWDGSKGRVGDNLGYNLCFATATPSMSRRIVPLRMTMWSAKEDGFTSENDKVLGVIRDVARECGKRGIYVYDRGGDGNWLFDFFIAEGLDFIVRLVGDRHLLHWNGKRLAADLAGDCEMKYRQCVTFKSHGKELVVPIEYGSLPVRLPDHPGVELRLVVVKWPRCEKPMMLLTTLRAARSRRSLQQVVEGYLTRWRVEETIRFVKQAYEIEDVRLLRYDRLKAMVAIVLAVAYFAMAWLGLREKLAVLSDHVKRVSRRMFEVPEFFFYAIADGVCRLFTRHGRWNGLDGPDEEPEEPCQLELALQ
jgi:hypothetical protein